MHGTATSTVSETEKGGSGGGADEGFQHDEEVPAARLVQEKMKTTTYMIVFACWIALSGVMVNFDLGYGGTVLQMESFRKTFGTCSMVPSHGGAAAGAPGGGLVEVCRMSPVAQSMVSLSSLFAAVGSALSAPFGRYLGRRGTIQAGCVLIAIGAAGQCATAGNYITYNVCKCISCIGIGNLNAGSPMYGVEVTPPQKRGALVALYSIGVATGTLISACVCYGTAKIGNDWEWRTPVICQIPLAVLYAVGLAFFPESPRWTLIKGREEKARLAFAKFYNKDPDSDAITAQVREIERYIELEKSASSTSSWTEVFHRTYLRRLLISILVAIATPLSGIALVGVYAAVFFAANGVKQPFLIQVCLGVCGVVGASCGPAIVEYGGRRFASLLGFASMAICMLVFSVVSSASGASTDTVRNVLIAFLCIWFFFYASCIASSHWLVAAEVHSLRLRTVGQAISVATANTFTFAAVFWTPYMINPTAGNMGTNVGYFYFGLDVIAFGLIFAFLPETARLTLEQIDDYFASGVPAWKTSTRGNKKIAKGQVALDGLK